ncbi:MAG: hypothetical protein N2487_02520 [Verrucomicrobiae bacterium]|nr:hypothetical protein [Verrucomicrobiae bacterium]
MLNNKYTIDKAKKSLPEQKSNHHLWTVAAKNLATLEKHHFAQYLKFDILYL